MGWGEGACKGGPRTLGRVGRRRAAVDLVPAVVADARVDNWRLGRLKLGDGRVARRVQEREIGRIKQRGHARRARAAEDTSAFATVLDPRVRQRVRLGNRKNIRVCARKARRGRGSRSCRRRRTTSRAADCVSGGSKRTDRD